MKILVIEDEAKAAAYLERGLRESGYTVDVADDGESGLQTALAEDYALIILDVMMPHRDGWSVLTELRRAGRNTLTLFLTARNQVEDRVRGLELGADAYLAKPFAFVELLALVRTLLRRGPPRTLDVVRFDGLELDFVQHRAVRDGRRLDLTLKEFQLLGLMARRAGEVLTRSMIASAVWGLNFDSDSNVVDVHIRRLRAKVDLPFGTRLIQTMRGVGYVLRNPVAP